MPMQIAQQQIIESLLEPFVEQIVEYYCDYPDYARIAILIAMSGRSETLLTSDIRKITNNANVIQATQFIGKLFNGEHNLRDVLKKTGDVTPADVAIEDYAETILPRLFFDAYQNQESFKNLKTRMRIYVVAYIFSMHNNNWYGAKGRLRDELAVDIHQLKSQQGIANISPLWDGCEGYSPANLSNLDLSFLQLPCSGIKHLNLLGCNLDRINFSGSDLHYVHINGRNKNIPGLSDTSAAYNFAIRSNSVIEDACLYESDNNARGVTGVISEYLDTIPTDNALTIACANQAVTSNTTMSTARVLQSTQAQQISCSNQTISSLCQKVNDLQNEVNTLRNEIGLQQSTYSAANSTRQINAHVVQHKKSRIFSFLSRSESKPQQESNEKLGNKRCIIL